MIAHQILQRHVRGRVAAQTFVVEKRVPAAIAGLFDSPKAVAGFKRPMGHAGPAVDSALATILRSAAPSQAPLSLTPEFTTRREGGTELEAAE
jgi:hypothetical protein